jgi:hypothetical protein
LRVSGQSLPCRPQRRRPAAFSTSIRAIDSPTCQLRTLKTRIESNSPTECTKCIYWRLHAAPCSDSRGLAPCAQDDPASRRRRTTICLSPASPHQRLTCQRLYNPKNCQIKCPSDKLTQRQLGHTTKFHILIPNQRHDPPFDSRLEQAIFAIYAIYMPSIIQLLPFIEVKPVRGFS